MKTDAVLSKDEVMDILRRQMPFLRQRYGVERIALYGSFARGKPTRRSDVDLLVELSRPLGLEFVALAEHMEAALGRKVDWAACKSFQRSLQDPRHRRTGLHMQESLTDVHD